jgi:formamidopyrimidine-DNA glycosylase
MYPTKQDAIQAAVDWVSMRDPESKLVGGSPMIWQPTLARDSERYLVTHDGLVGRLFVATSPNRREGHVTAVKESSGETNRFTWQDDGEYVRLKRAREAKAHSARQAASAGPSLQTKLFGQRVVRVASRIWQRIVEG